MMRRFSFYHKDTGILQSAHLSISDHVACIRNVEANTPPDHEWIEGQYDHLSQRVEPTTKKIIDYKPPQPSADHEWNTDKKRWQLTSAVRDKQRIRADALAQIVTLERRQHRAIREAVLNQPEGIKRLATIEEQIATLRKVLNEQS